ncbi:dTDP-4-dehydrorhamnose reductase [Intrasporangium sp. DVR]|uniref:dTDP-4-dehydrorhamnose reductase n=1 Tax=Intrasporangium sp. DVR TaxID=3127867 RepID=UPI003342AFE8
MTSPRRILVTGAAGLLAHDLVPALRGAGHVVTAMGRDDLDVTSPAECVAATAGHDLVVNCAAWTRVDEAEGEEGLAFAVNALGAANVARGAARTGARVVQLSTDYVFDGQSTQPYAAEHPPSPLSAYARTKVAGEWAVRALCADSWVVRTAWLYGGGGPNFVSTILRLADERGTLDVVDDQRGQPTWTRDLAELLVRMIDADAGPGTYHATASGETTWHGLARAVFEERGLDPQRVRPTTTEHFRRPARRPAYAVLSNRSLDTVGVAPIRDWREALAEYLRR